MEGTPELPGLVRSFVAYFTRYIEEQNATVRQNPCFPEEGEGGFVLSFHVSPPFYLKEIHSIYENSFPKLTERFFKNKCVYLDLSISLSLPYDFSCIKTA